MTILYSSVEIAMRMKPHTGMPSLLMNMKNGTYAKGIFRLRPSAYILKKIIGAPAKAGFVV